MATALGLLGGPAVLVAPSSAGSLPFPYVADFSDVAGGTLSGDAAIVDGRLRLTDDELSQAGAWSTDDTFSSDLGLDIEFDYAMYHEGTRAGADGLLLFLADGAAPQGVGQSGAGLGYACRFHETQGGDHPCDLPGLPGAFAGVAIDRYGNFSLPLNLSGPGAAPDSVVVRGSGDGLDGYRYVAGTDVPRGVQTDGPEPRTVRVTLLPQDDGGLALTVRLETEAGALRTVLDQVPLHGDGQAPLPPTLRLGFAASTGSYVDVHEVDELRVQVPVDLAVDQDLAPEVTAGEQVRWDVVARDAGPSASDPSRLTVDVPAGLRDVSWTCRGVDGGTCGAGSGTGAVSTDLGLPRGAGAVVTVTGTVPDDATGTLTSRAVLEPASGLADTFVEDNVSVAETRVRDDDGPGPGPVARLGTEKSVEPATDVRPGDALTYALTARNDGSVDAERVGVTDELPAAVRFIGSDDDCTADGQLVTCRSADTLAPGERRTFTIRTVLDETYRGDGSDVVNVATATSPSDPDGGDPSPGVAVGVVDPGDGDGGADGDGGGGTGASPTPVPATDTAGPGTGGRGPGSGPGRGGSLAYTGSSGLGLLALVGAAVTALGGTGWWAVRRRRARADTTDPAGG
ncbi:DUF11 domain-containing protein [Curtobacterium sp. Csp1]|uniref:DUF7507 domain-containing protein n=1 Tax=unclassified Curtobacterium TaxID=257496 RepID=UPI001597FD6C|nr:MULTISPECIES: LPXTG cell wall anchor domain-containing protein [unclassified Curtobacterium]QKS12620.1 DUF11 domain-containing protein [Curtobacterium sp. csp3]QKS20237.1 DUF11 domain-containing protein [Curtobacterium sp. Csp1]